jgi:transposase
VVRHAFGGLARPWRLSPKPEIRPRQHQRDPPAEQEDRGRREATCREGPGVGTTLSSLQGIGFVVAAKILGEVGDPARVRSKSAFAMLTGTAPIEASSGDQAAPAQPRGQPTAQLRPAHDGPGALVRNARVVPGL